MPAGEWHTCSDNSQFATCTKKLQNRCHYLAYSTWDWWSGDVNGRPTRRCTDATRNRQWTMAYDTLMHDRAGGWGLLVVDSNVLWAGWYRSTYTAGRDSWSYSPRQKAGHRKLYQHHYQHILYLMHYTVFSGLSIQRRLQVALPRQNYCLHIRMTLFSW